MGYLAHRRLSRGEGAARRRRSNAGVKTSHQRRNDKPPATRRPLEQMTGACVGAREQGLPVPDDVSVVGFDDIVLAHLVNPPPTIARQTPQEVAQVAIRHFVERAQRGKNSPNSMVRPPGLVVRASTA